MLRLKTLVATFQYTLIETGGYQRVLRDSIVVIFYGSCVDCAIVHFRVIGDNLQVMGVFDCVIRPGG